MGAIITNKDGYGWDNATNFIDQHGRYYGLAPAVNGGTGFTLTYSTTNVKTIYVQNHTFAPARINKIMALNWMASDDVYYYDNGGTVTSGILTMTITYSLTGIIDGAATSATVVFKKTIGSLSKVASAGDALMAAELRIDGYAIGPVVLSIESVVANLSATGSFVTDPGTATNYSSTYIAYYPMHEAGI